MVLSLACSEMRMTPAEAITAATVNGAHALGWGEQAGTLEPDRTADLLIMNVSDYRDIPFVFGVNHVHVAVRRGEVVYHEEGGA
jgi:imidazolonepropionase